ncbi:hypothetical protein [uncultured Ilyobacter sp.]|uniref:hypothetical protein n=1 Tax=uncultured Ilyobacter sp. TaxID=544433 RepID=UPI0029C0CD7D|nr:hypothetical protein [uncultured Ilyobacter sp.]
MGRNNKRDALNIIFHIPYKLDSVGSSGRMMRPYNLIKAFREEGHNLYLIEGDWKERQIQIKQLKESIKSGEKFDLLYSEASTKPTLIAEKDNIPKFPFIDFQLFKLCKLNNIKSSLFYRDIYWNLKEYKEYTSIFKRTILKCLYYLDLSMYNKYIDILYLPSMEMYEYIPFKFNGKVKVLSPGANISMRSKNNKNKKLNFFYVGGLGMNYDLELLCEVIVDTPEIKMTICCRKEDFEKEKERYKKFIERGIKIIHLEGKKLEEEYSKMDIGILYFKPSVFRRFASPLKLYEYVGQGLPILASKNTLAGKIVEKVKIGWSLEYEKEALESFIQQLLKNRDDFINKKISLIKKRGNFTWIKRTQQVITDFEELKNEET